MSPDSMSAAMPSSSSANPFIELRDRAATMGTSPRAAARNAAPKDVPVSSACSATWDWALSPMPRRGVLMMRRMDTSSSGLATTRR